MIFKLFATITTWLGEATHNPIRRFQVALTALTLLLLYGTGGYILIERMPLLDAFYMTVITVTTIGFGEIHPLSPTGRIFTVSVIVLGVAAATAAVSESIRITLEPVLWKSIQRRRMERQRMKIKDHYIVCGFGRVGRQVVRDLQARRVPFIVVDQTDESEALFAERKISYVIGDATREDTLEKAQIAHARGLVSVLTNDADNIMTVLTARMLNPSLNIIARVVRAESEQKLRLVGANQVINPYQIGGHRIALSLLRPAVNQFLHRIFHFDDDEDNDIGQLNIGKSSPHIAQPLSACRLRERGMTTVAIVRANGEMSIAPPETQILAAGDQIVIIGASPDVYKLEQEYGQT
jgi:voltage-gated potassium channel